MVKTCYLILMSSGLDSTAALLNLVNKLVDEDAHENSVLFPVYIWWRTIFTKVIQKEYCNCLKIIDYIKNRYKDIIIKPLTKITIPLIFYEEIREEFKEIGRTNYWAHFRNAFFILSSLNFLLNYLNLKEITDFQKIVIVTGFAGHEVDENKTFIQNIEKMLNDIIIDEDGTKNPYIIDYAKKIEFYCPYILENKLKSRSRQYFDFKKFDCWDILDFTWSCWRSDTIPCYECGGCQSRISKYEGFKKGSEELKDPFFKDEIHSKIS